MRRWSILTIIALGIVGLSAAAVPASGTKETSGAKLFVQGQQPAAGEVVLFEHVDYEGVGQIFTQDVADLSGTEIGAGRVSSIKVKDAAVMVFELPNFKGRSQMIKEDMPTLVGSHIGNDTISSIRVFVRAGEKYIPAPKK